MSAVNLWKPRKLLSYTWLTKPGCEWRFVRTSENRALTGESVGKFRIWLTPINIFSAPFSSLLHRTWARHREQILKRSETTAHNICRKKARKAGGRNSLCFGTKRERKKPVGYCNASIRRVIVRFRSLSDRRNSSILLIECSTVVWCLPPNWRPISGSEAVVSCLTIYIAT